MSASSAAVCSSRFCVIVRWRGALLVRVSLRRPALLHRLKRIDRALQLLKHEIHFILRGFLVILPMAFLLSQLFSIRGVWCSFPATELLVAAVGLVFYLHSGKQAEKTA